MDSYPIFPFYVVIDVSVSMQSYIGALNAELPALQVAVQEDPIVGDIARFGIIAFSDEAEMLLPLSDLLEVSHMPTLQPVGGTNYAAAFELLYQAIPTTCSGSNSTACRCIDPQCSSSPMDSRPLAAGSSGTLR
ncbi:MAG: VWA domain-containing protein [Acidimicrobiia bacterium]|nr:VWA domain-containing protein [Acidimicrobiia bacterium]